MNTMTFSKRARALVMAALLLPLGLVSAANADDYTVFGQVFQISVAKAADQSIADGALAGDGYPYVLVKVYDLDTGDFLGEDYTGANGQYTVTFTLPGSPPAPRIDCRVYQVVDDDATLLAPAREEINHFPKVAGGIAPFQHALLNVASDEILEYGSGGLYSYPGVGLVMTRVGKVEIPEIDQDVALANRPVAGLADYTGNEPRATELGLPAFKQAPFAGRLMMFGDFGLPSGSDCPATFVGSEIDWYQVKIKKVDEAAAGVSYDSELLWQDPMSKRRTRVTTWPALEVEVTTEPMGPFTGYEDDLTTFPIDRGASVPAIYRVNRNVVGGPTNIFYSFPDLRVNWVSSAANGLYEISLVYYRSKPGTADEFIIEEIPFAEPTAPPGTDTCFASGVPAGDADKVALHKLYLRVDNHKLVARFDHIYLRNKTTSDFYAGDSVPDSPTEAGALDFNDEGLCEIMHLAGAYDVEVRFTAHHEGDYMLSYSLAAVPNNVEPPDPSVVSYASATFDPTVTPLDPSWEGTPAAGTSVTRSFTDPPNPACAYRFRLHAHSRLQNGYQRVQHRHPDLAYYVDP